jgi:hypothetical protein
MSIEKSRVGKISNRIVVIAVMGIITSFMLFSSNQTQAAGDLTINTARNFFGAGGCITAGGLDGSADDADGIVNGVLTVMGNLTITGTGSINANDPATPVNNGACPIKINVSGNMTIQSGGAIFAENRVVIGNGGNIDISVGGDLLLDGSGATGATISSSNPTGASNGPRAAGNITINVLGKIDLNSGSTIAANTTFAGSPGGNITITAGGNLALHGDGTNGARITADQVASSCTGSGHGGNVTLTSNNKNITTDGGSAITVDAKCSAGEIKILAPNGDIDVDGLVESFSGLTGVGATQPPGGGPITIDAACNLTISDTGKVSSRGLDPGADLVHLEACTVEIDGLVESTGSGHAIPNSPPNHLDGSNRPDKPSNSTGGVEVWAGGNLTINSLTASGEVKADIGITGGPQGRGWIDLFAKFDIRIIGDTGGAFAVHANGGIQQNTDDGGLVTVKSKSGKVTASGLALQADATTDGSNGGIVTVQAATDVNLDTASIFARGDFNGPGFGHGGTINVRAFTGSVSWATGVGNVEATGVSVPAAMDGKINITHCTGFTPGATFPTNGGPDPGFPNIVMDCTGTAPFFPCEAPGSGCIPYVVLPDCALCQPPPDTNECKWCNKGAVISQVVQNMGGNCAATPDIVVDVRLASTTIDTTKLGTNEPATGSLQAAVDYINANGDLNGDGFLFIAVTAKDCTSTIGNCTATNGFPARPLGGSGSENVVVTNTRSLRLNIFACSVTLTAKDPSKPVITIKNSVGKVTVLDIHVQGSTVAGYLIQNNADLVTVKNARSKGNDIGYWVKDDKVEITGSPDISGNRIGVLLDNATNVTLRTNNMIQDNSLYGIQVNGSSNELNGNDVGDKGHPNGAGIVVSGNSNNLHDNDVYGNTGDGVNVTGNTNTIKQNDIGEKDKGNGGDGIHVNGYGNTIDGNDVFGNGGDGIDVSGGTAAKPNIVVKNDAGDRNKGNAGNGIVVAGVGNGTGSPIEIDSNTVKQNGLVGIKVTGTGHQLKNNESGGSGDQNNGGCEFNVGAGNFNATGNKANGTTVTPNTNNAAFPAGCSGTP